MISKNGENGSKVKAVDGINMPRTNLMEESTWSQIWYAPYTTQPRIWPYYTRGNWNKTVRQMRVDPTIAIVRDLTQALILSAEWNVEEGPGAPEGAKTFIEKELAKWRDHIIRHGICGMIDFGWQAFEKVYRVDEQTDMLHIKKLKPLIQDRTQILIDPDNGDFIGVYQEWDHIVLTGKETFHLAWQIEGTDWYGRPLMKNVEEAWKDWNDSDKSANLYDRKVAGSHWVIYYPPGMTKIDGVVKDNYLIAQDLINILEHSTGIAIPTYVKAFLEELDNEQDSMAWKVELLSDTTNQQQNFVDRQRYLDSLKVRGFGFPERAVIEGQFGTKAEAGVHQNIAMVIVDDRQKIITDCTNYQVVRDLMFFNYGPESVGTIWVSPTSVSDSHQQLLRELYDKILEDPEAFAEEMLTINRQTIRQDLGIPVEKEIEG